MPLALHLTPAPRLRTFDRRIPEQILHQEADRLAVELRTLWAQLFTDAQQGIGLVALREAVRTGQLFAIEAFLAPFWERSVDSPARALLPPLLLETLQATAEALAPQVAVTLGIEASALPLPASVPWVATYTGEQIVSITQTTRLAIRGLIRQELATGTSAQQLAQAIKAEIGLTPRQVRTVEALRTRLARQGIPQREIARRVESASRTGLQHRALTIARTEAMTAANAGQQELWRQAVQQGYLDPAEWVREWHTARDEIARKCPICGPMDGQRRGIEEPFLTGTGVLVFMPTAHPSCRCTMILVPVGTEERSAA